ncbi:MAG: DUF5335 family protein [Pyrinomonadaceae bacterium]|nr:DUF5335 family protein [Acidobacteriota bacterium]MBP7375596.1 DUF5335 family protein [Pyrinomonadaceae bacterium]
MTSEIQKFEWKAFLDKLSRDAADWESRVLVMNDREGVQILSEGLPFNGVTLDEKGGKTVVELLIGSGTENHQTHNIKEPVKVAFEPVAKGPAGTLDIEDVSGTKTLITLIGPMPVLAVYTRTEMVAVL